MKVTVIPLVTGGPGTVIRGLGNKRLSGDHPNYSIVEISENTEKCPGDMRRVRNCLDAHLGQIVCDKDRVVDWCIVLVEMPLTRFEECWSLPTESLPELH